MRYNKDSEGRLMITDQQASELYLDYVNNYLTVAKFAEDLDTSKSDAENIINRGRIVHENRVMAQLYDSIQESILWPELDTE